MSTYMPKAEEIERSWYVIDAAGKSVGRVAAQAAFMLRGKHKPIFVPHVDCGDHIIIINCAKAVLTGHKLEKKIYYRHSGYIGNLKAVKAGSLMKSRPERVMMMAVKGMLPKTSQGRTQLTRLRVYAGAEHKHEAQKPVLWEN